MLPPTRVVSVVEPPTDTLVSLSEAKAHVRAQDFADDDLYLSSLLVAAEAHLSAPGQWFGRSLARRTLELSIACPVGPEVLPGPPFHELLEVTFDDAAGVSQALPLADLRKMPWVGDTIAVFPLSGRWPDIGPFGRLRVRYTAGYLAEDERAAPIRQAVLLMVAHWYANREMLVDGRLGSTPMGVEALLSPLRIWGV